MLFSSHSSRFFKAYNLLKKFPSSLRSSRSTMGACASAPKTLEGDAPVELPVEKETTVTASEVTPVEEASATTEVTTQSSESTEENKENKEEKPLMDVSKPKEEAVTTNEEVAKENKEEVVVESEIVEEKPTTTIEAKPTQA